MREIKVYPKDVRPKRTYRRRKSVPVVKPEHQSVHPKKYPWWVRLAVTLQHINRYLKQQFGV